MLNVGDTVVFGTLGVFTIEETTQKVICGKKTEYFVLRSTSKDSTTVYLPMDNPSLLDKAKPLVTPEEIGRLIDNIPNSEDYWVDDHKKRKERFNRILQSGDRGNIMALAGTLRFPQFRFAGMPHLIRPRHKRSVSPGFTAYACFSVSKNRVNSVGLKTSVPSALKTSARKAET